MLSRDVGFDVQETVLFSSVAPCDPGSDGGRRDRTLADIISDRAQVGEDEEVGSEENGLGV